MTSFTYKIKDFSTPRLFILQFNSNKIKLSYYNIIVLSVLYLEPNFQKLCMAMDPFLCNFTYVLSETKSMNVIFLSYFQYPI